MPGKTNKQKKNQKKNKTGTRDRSGRILQDVGMSGRNVLAPTAVRLRAFGLPAVYHMPLRYVESGVLVATAGSLALYQFRTNSLFDPDLTGTGHQPYGFDQMKTYYASYLVTASKISVECLAATSAALAGVFTSAESSTGITTADGYMEPGKGQGGIVWNYFTRAFESEWSLASIADHDPADYSALISANPTNSDFFTVFAQDAFSLASTPTVYFTVAIEYQATFKDPVTFATS